MKFGIGQPVTRKEDRRFLTGKGQYTDDIIFPDQAYAFVLRSTHAHAGLRSVDTAAAISAPGVLCVLTGEDAEREGMGAMTCRYLSYVAAKNRGAKDFNPPHPVLAAGNVRHVGDGVALVVAATPEQARDAAERIMVDYEPLPAVTHTATASHDGMPLVWEDIPNNLCFDWANGDEAATDAAFAKAPHVAAVELVNNRVVGNPMEPRAAIGLYDAASEAYTLYTSTQGSHAVRNILAEQILHVPDEKVRVVTPDVGGGFGIKLFAYVEYALVMWAARETGRPVKWTSDRSQAFVTDTQGRDHVTRAELALDAEGKFLALRATTIANMGAYLSSAGPVIPTYASRGIQLGVYDIPAAFVSVKGVVTNTVPVDAYRGAGRPEAVYLIERLVDKAARVLGINPGELRRRNFIPSSAMPFTTPLELTYDSGEFALNLEEAIALAGCDEFPGRRAEARHRGKLRGLGIAYYVEKSSDPATGSEAAVVRFEEDETVSVLIGTQSSGQGHETSYAQLAAEQLGVPFEKVNVRQGDTAEIATGSGTGASRSMTVGGMALTRAVNDVVEKGKEQAANLLEVAREDIDYSEGRYSVVGTDRWSGIFEVARAARNREDGDGLFDGSGDFDPEAPTFPNGCHVCEVEVDPETGLVDIVRFTVVDDFGKVVNPLLVAGQVHGGLAQGIGQAILERTVYDEESGQLLTGSFMDYGIPRAADMPAITAKWNEIPCRTNALGIKGAGEAGAVGAPPAVINAILDALTELGVGHIDMPATPETVWRAIQAARP